MADPKVNKINHEESSRARARLPPAKQQAFT